MKTIILIVMAFLLTACVSANALGSQSEVDQNLDKWRDARISHYRYDLFLSCFCVFNEDMPLHIEVRDGKVVSMEYESGKAIDPSLLEFFERYATIDRVFTEVKAGLNGAAAEVIEKYDPAHGFPTEVKIDVEKQATDDELYLTLSNFEKLP